MAKRTILLSAIAGILVLPLAWRLFFSGASVATLAQDALQSETTAERQQAALRLIVLNDATKQFDTLVTHSSDPAVRAIVAQGIADADDYSSVNTLFDLLDDPSPTVRTSAINALDRLLRCRTKIPVDDTAANRDEIIDRIRKRWTRLLDYELLDELKHASSLSYYYNLHTNQIFEAPSHLHSAFSLPAGPYDGMPAAVRVEIFTSGDCQNPSERIVGWLSVDDFVLAEHGVTLPPRPAESESTLIRRVEDKDWVYATSPAGRKIFDKVVHDGVWSCRPGK